jgi:hypothetical protein
MASKGTDFVVKTPKGLAKRRTQILTTKVAVKIGVGEDGAHPNDRAE